MVVPYVSLYLHVDIEDSKKCRPGYVGRYCRARCIYPYYGEECNCSEPMCDVATGCKTDDRGMAHLLSIRSIKVNQTSFILHLSK